MADNKTQIIITAKDETRAAIASAQSGMKLLSDQAARFGANPATMAAAAVGAMAILTKSAIDAADAIGKTAQKVGVTAESLSALTYAGKLSDVSMEQLSTGLKKLSVNLNDIATGGNTDAAAALKALGISAKDAGGNLRNADSVFADVAEAFAGMQDGAGKTALAVALFGKAGADLIPMLNAGKTGLRDAGDEAQRFGLIVGGEAAKAAEEFNDNLTRISSAAQGVGQRLAADLLPPLSELAKELVNTARESGSLTEMLGGGLRNVLQTLIVLGSDVAFVFKMTAAEIEGMGKQLVALTRMDYSSFKKIGAAMRDGAKEARAELDAFQARVMNPPGKEYIDGWRPASAGKSAAPTFASTSGSKGSASTVSEGDRLIQQLRERLYASQELSEVEKLMAQFADGRYKKMADGERDAALYIASQLDARKAMNSELADEAKLIAETIKLEETKANRLASLVAGTDSGKAAQRESDEALAWEALGAGSINSKEFDQIINNLNEVKKAGKDTFSELESAINGWGKQSAKAITDFAISGKGSFSDLAKSIISDIGQMAIYAAINPFFENIAGKNSAFGGAISGLFGGGRANGGPVNPGQYYVVGERGPEILVPGTSGTVIPNGAGGGQSNISINIDASGTRSGNDAGSAGELARRLESAVRGVMMVEKRPGGLLA